MTSKLKCPVCQQDLGVILCDLDDFFCPGCRMWGSEKLWQALIQAKQDLKIATNALREICNDYQEDSTERAEKALEQIEHKE